MSTEIRIWEINNNCPEPVANASLASSHKEDELELWIVQRPEILGENFLIIDRQREIEGVGRLDLLCIDPSGKLAIVELKRDRAPREAVVQALDYASWLDEANEEQIGRYAQEYLQRPLGEAFKEHFGTDMPELVCQVERKVKS